jgi:hypothetical protein
VWHLTIHVPNSGSDLSQRSSAPGAVHLFTCLTVPIQCPYWRHFEVARYFHRFINWLTPHIPNRCFITQLLFCTGSSFAAHFRTSLSQLDFGLLYSPFAMPPILQLPPHRGFHHTHIGRNTCKYCLPRHTAHGSFYSGIQWFTRCCHSRHPRNSPASLLQLSLRGFHKSNSLRGFFGAL